MPLPCPRCSELARLLSGDVPTDRHVCELLDTDIVRHMCEARPVTFGEAVATSNVLERNLARVRIFTLTNPFPSDPAAFVLFAIKLHRAFLTGTELHDGGGRFRAGPITYGPESKLRHGVAAERIGDELHRLSRRCLPVDARTLTRPVLVTTGAKLVHGFLRVHPFPDINGRTARALFAALVAATGRYSRPLPRDDDRQAHKEYVVALQSVDWALDYEDRVHDEHYAPLARWLDHYVEEPEEEPDEPAQGAR